MQKFEFVNLTKQRVFDAILQKKQTLNFSMLKTCLRKKDIKVNGKRIKENVEVFENDQIEVFLNTKKAKQIDVIFEDNNIIVAHKPQGIETTKKDKTFLESESLEELVDAANALGVNLYACEMAMHVLGLEKKDFINEVKDVLGVATFLKISEGGQTLFI